VAAEIFGDRKRQLTRGKAIPDLLAHLLSHCQNPAHRHLLVDGANHLSNEVRCADRLNPPSMFGNTHAVADAIGKGLGQGLESVDDVVVVPVAEAGRERLGDADLLVVGAPTHFHGMSRTRTRKWAGATAQNTKNDLVLDRDAQGPGVSDWLTSLGRGHATVAAFDTRFKGPAVLRGKASRLISRRLRRRGFEEVAAPESFFVTLQNRLEPGEEARAQEWGKRLAASVASNGLADADRAGQPPTSTEA
jgi:hypothetical protein